MKKAVAIRATLDAFSKNIGIDYKTLSKGIRANEAKPDKSGTYSLKDLCAAAFGDMDAAKLRNLILDAELKEREKAEKDRLLVPVNLVARAWENIILGMRQVIIHSPLTEKEKDKILLDLKTIPLDDYFESASEDDSESLVSSPEAP